MANLARRLTLLPQCRWMCAAAETIQPVVVSTADSSSMFRKLRNVEVKDNDGSGCELKKMLDDWVEKGVYIKRHHVVSWIVQLRRFHKYSNALQISEWLENKNKFTLNNSDRAVRIDLIFATKGVAEAEKYFDNLQPSAKTTKTYGALLSCYCRENMLEKAVELFQKMKNSEVTPTTLNMNQLMHLYLKVGQPEKVPLLVKDLEDMKFIPDKYTYNHLMNSYAAMRDYDGAEKVLDKMMENEMSPDWFTYSTLAKIHIDGGYFEKAIDVLERIENIERLRDPEAFQHLITLYAKSNNRLGVFRAWESLKKIQKNVSSDGYLSLIYALAELGDQNDLETYFKEWESCHSIYDIRICNVLLEYYLNRDMLTEAKSLADSLVAKEIKPTFRTLTLYMDFHLKKGQTDTAIQYLEQGVARLKERKHSDQFPTNVTVKLFLNSFKENSDSANAQKFHEIMKGLNRLDSKMIDALLASGYNCNATRV